MYNKTATNQSASCDNIKMHNAEMISNSLVRRILLHSPDITLKGKNQAEFQSQLASNVEHRLTSIGLSWTVEAARGRVSILIPKSITEDVHEVVSALASMAGVSSLANSYWLRRDSIINNSNHLNWSNIDHAIICLAREYYCEKNSYALRVNRVDKSIPVTSQDIATRLGEIIRTNTEWDSVNLSKPDLTFYIDAYPDGMYLYVDKIRGVGGLPVGTGGRVLALLSGGIDSPVAAFFMSKRGCAVDLFHLSASHTIDHDIDSSVILRLAREISRYSLSSRLFIVPYTYFDMALNEKETRYGLVLFRRFMLRMAEIISGQTKASALVTGDCLGQVASQTIENLASAIRSVSLPVFQPLIGMNKLEIIEQAERINTYKISIEPSKDCCALIGKHPKTRSHHEILQNIENDIFPDYRHIIDKTLNDMITLEFDCGRQIR